MIHDFIQNIEKLHTTELGTKRIKNNLSLETEDVVLWCKTKILDNNAVIEKRGKNWYITIEQYQITVNCSAYTIITAHKIKDL